MDVFRTVIKTDMKMGTLFRNIGKIVKKVFAKLEFDVKFEVIIEKN